MTTSIHSLRSEPVSENNTEEVETNKRLFPFCNCSPALTVITLILILAVLTNIVSWFSPWLEFTTLSSNETVYRSLLSQWSDAPLFTGSLHRNNVATFYEKATLAMISFSELLTVICLICAVIIWYNCFPICSPGSTILILSLLATGLTTGAVCTYTGTIEIEETLQSVEDRSNDYTGVDSFATNLLQSSPKPRTRQPLIFPLTLDPRFSYGLYLGTSSAILTGVVCIIGFIKLCKEGDLVGQTDFEPNDSGHPFNGAGKIILRNITRMGWAFGSSAKNHKKMRVDTEQSPNENPGT